MAYDFPTSPAAGTLFAPPGGPTWRWSGSVWSQIAPSGLVPEAPLDGQNYLRKNGQWAVAPGTADRFNHVVNGAMQISQENGTTVVASGNYPADQFLMSSPIATTQTQKGLAGLAAPDGSDYISTVVATAKPALAASDYWQIVQFIEGNRVQDFKMGGATARQAVVRFWAYSSQVGTYSFALKNGVPDRLFFAPFTISVANTWTEINIVIPGDTTGTWANDNTRGMIMGWGLAAGATYNAAVAGWQSANNIQMAGHTNLAQTANNVFNLTNVGLYLDPNNTGLAPRWETPDYAKELSLCQRYYQRNVFIMLSCNCTAASTYYTIRPSTVPVRASPTLSGTDVPNASGFPAASGTIQFIGDVNQAVIRESRVCNLTGPSAFQSSIIANMRM